jgi:MFS family permease
VLRQAGRHIELTPENNKRVLRKIDTHILPVILAVYFLQALDKATLAYASVFGLVEGANLHGLQYSWLGSVVYLAQLVAQPLVAYLLVKLPLGKFLAATVLLWGIILSVMPAANTFAGLLVTRMLLGLFEAGVAPTFIAVTQMWWRRREQPVRLGAWYASMFPSPRTWLQLLIPHSERHHKHVWLLDYLGKRAFPQLQPFPLSHQTCPGMTGDLES